MTVGVKYCGGCNPRYDRTGLVRTLEQAAPGAVFLPARPETVCDLLLVVCGCPARCADVSGLRAGKTVYLCGPADAAAALAAL